MAEVSHHGYVHVLRRGNVPLLSHAGTGELVRLPHEDDAWRLKIPESGVGMLERHAAERLPVSTFFRKLLCTGCRPGCEEPEHFIYDGETRSSTWKADLLGKADVLAFDIKALGRNTTALQVYTFAACTGTRVRVWWAVEFVLQAIVEGDIPTNHVGKHRDTFERVLAGIGLPAAYLRSNRRSRITAAALHGGDEYGGEHGLALQFWTLSTSGLVGMLLYWSYHKTKDTAGFTINSNATSSLLDKLVEAACKQGPWDATMPDGSVLMAITDEGLVDLDELASAVDHPSIAQLRQFMKKDKKHSFVKLAAIMHRWYSQLQRPSRSRSFNVELGRAWLRCIAISLQLQLEVSVEEPWWRATSHLALSPAESSKSGRHKLISKAYKYAVVEAAREAPCAMSSSALLVANSLFVEQKAPADAPGMNSTACRMKLDYMLGYLAAGRVLFKAPRCLQYSIDAVRAGGEENNLYFAFLPGKTLAGLPPVQVHGYVKL